MNINSLLSKIDELWEIARKTRATVIGITESKLDGLVLDGEINIDGYELVRSDRNRHGGGVACYIRSDISFNVRGAFFSEIENIFLDILLPKTKPILIGILYRPPDQSKFLDNNNNNKKRSHTQLDSRKQVIAFQDRVITINIKEAQHPLKREKQVIDKSSIMLKISTKSMHRVQV